MLILFFISILLVVTKERYYCRIRWYRFGFKNREALRGEVLKAL